MATGLAGATAPAHMGLPNAGAAPSRDNRAQTCSALGGILLFSFDSRRRLWQCRRPNPLSLQEFPSRTTRTTRSRKLAKPEWGTKRICPSCGARYYDLMRDPVVCPKCSTPFDPEAFLKARRSRPAAPVEKELEPVGANEIDPDRDADETQEVEEEEEDVSLDETEEEDEELIEDASELGEDEDDMAEVIDNVEDEET
jgi:uncharacterized protein (TIGR02300 family)